MNSKIQEYLNEYKFHLETEMKSLKNGSSLLIYQNKINDIDNLLIEITQNV